MGTSGYQLDPSLLPQYGQPYQPAPFNPNAGLPATMYGYQIGAQGDPSLSYQPDLSTNDPNRIYRNAQNVSYNLGAGIDASTYQMQQQQQGLYDQYGQAANAAYGQLAQQPGYSAGDAANIEQVDRINSAVTPADQYAALNPTGAETAGMTGNVGSYSQFYNPQAINDVNNSMGTNMSQAIGATQGNMTNEIGQQQQALDKAQNTPGLSPSANYYAGMSNVLNTTADRLNKAQNTPGLNTTAEYARQAGMTDQEVGQTATQAATNIGLQSQAQKDAIARSAAAAGNASPLAVAAAQSRAGVQGMVATGDAVTDAQLAARAQQRQAATGVQQTQLGAAQYQGSLGSQNAQYEGNLAQQNVQNVQNTDLTAAQYRAGLASQNANTVAGNQLQSSQYTGAQGVNAAQAMGAQGLAGQEYLQSQGANLAMAQDQAAANRASQLYGIRQGNTQYGQQSNYQQNMGAASALSGNYQTVANQALNGQQQYRNYLTGQQSQALGAAQTANQQRIGNYGVMSGAMNQNAANWGNYQLGKSQQGFGTNFVQGLGSSLGKGIAGGFMGSGLGG